MAVTSPAGAVDPSDGKKAEGLFTEAMALIDDGRFAEACPKLEESQRLDPALGTQYNLALCEAKIGRYARAWHHMKAVEKLAHATGKRAREESAREKLVAFRARVVYLVVTSAEETVVVRVDGEIVDPESFALFPVEPGKHRIEASSPSKQPWSRDITVPGASGDGSGAAVEVAIPELPSIVRERPLAPPVSASRDGNTGRRTVGYVLGGVGLAGVATAITTGILVLDAKSTVEERCTPACADQAGRDALSSGRALLPINAIAWGVGVSGLIAGGIVLLLSPRTARPASGLTPLTGAGGAGVAWQGRF
jgi:hypothetical protein